MKYHVQHREWRPLSLPTEEARIAHKRLQAILDTWEGTPYMAGQQLCQVGIDCVRFVCQVYNELHYNEPIPLAQLPPDAAMHDRAGAVSTMLKIAKAYAPITMVQDNTLEPGDVVVVSYAGGGPGHAMIVGTEKNVLYHAASIGIVRTGLGFATGQQMIHGVFRKDNRLEWAIENSN